MRLAPFSIFAPEGGQDSLFERYFDHGLNRQILEKVAKKCYLPANAVLLDALEKNPDLKLAFSTTGVFLEQARLYMPEVVESFAALAKTGRVEFLSETYYHSLSSLFSEKTEFEEQVKLHQQAIAPFGQTPTVFRNTESMFSNDIAYWAERMGYVGIMTEGLDQMLGWRSPTYTYKVKGCPNIRALLRHYKLSDDIGYRFSQKSWSEWPLTAPKFANWLAGTPGDCVNLFMDYETFGEHHWEDTGIFAFLRALFPEISNHKHLSYATPSEVAKSVEPKGEVDMPSVISWADNERDTSAWLGNDMQRSAFAELTALEKPIKELGDADLLRTWRHLQNSDHLYYCCTKSLSDQDVHNYFSPYESPFESFINYMNVLQDLKAQVKKREKR
ncbi:Glycosyl hydrolase family 57 [uncultured archaeon]|nr:Glycosyl hydrolase family 57 [uncultured archaeon]